MRSSCCSSASRQTLTVLCVQILCLAGWPLVSEATRIRCGTDLIEDLQFVCGDRGFNLKRPEGKRYHPRPRGKGIADQCCNSPMGCGLHILEQYCATAKIQQQQQSTTASAATTAASAPTTGATAAPSTTQPNMAQQSGSVFLKRLFEHLGVPRTPPKKKALRKKAQPAVERSKGKVSSPPSSRRTRPADVRRTQERPSES